MWQDKLKKLKKPAAKAIKKPLQSTSTSTLSDIDFSSYCRQNKITPIKQNTANVYKPPIKEPKAKIIITASSNNNNFMFINEGSSLNEFFRYGQKNLPKELRLGKFKINATLDLHNYTKAHAMQLLTKFLTQHGTATCIKIIHGMGNNSTNNQAVLLHVIRQYLYHLPQVIAYTYGSNNQGGEGVTIIKLKPAKKFNTAPHQ